MSVSRSGLPFRARLSSLGYKKPKLLDENPKATFTFILIVKPLKVFKDERKGIRIIKQGGNKIEE